MTIKNDFCIRGDSLADLGQISKLLKLNLSLFEQIWNKNANQNVDKYLTNFILLIVF